MPQQQHGTTELREMWCHYGGRGSEFNEFGISCEPPGSWSDPTFYGKPIGGVPTVAVDAFYALERALKSEGYQAQSVWAYNSRPIASSGKPSLHGYGIAIDIDPNENPQADVPPFSGKFTQAQVDAVMGIRLSNGKRPWWWGGYWSGITLPDLMHWQMDCSPAEATTIDWTTVPGATPEPEPGEELEYMDRDAQEYFQAIYDSLKASPSNGGPDKPSGETNPPGARLFSYLASFHRWATKKTDKPGTEYDQIVARFMDKT